MFILKKVKKLGFLFSLLIFVSCGQNIGFDSLEDVKKKQEKLSLYFFCIDNYSSFIYEDFDSYKSQISSWRKGPQEGDYISFYEMRDIKKCKEKIFKAKNMLPQMKKIENTGEEYGKKIKNLESIWKQCFDYYSQKQFLVDDMIRGKYLHKKLLNEFEKFKEVDENFEKLIFEKKEEIDLREIVLLEKEENKFLYFRKNILFKMKKIVDLISVSEMDLLNIKKKNKDLKKLLDDFNKYRKNDEQSNLFAAGVGEFIELVLKINDGDNLSHIIDKYYFVSGV